MPKRAYAVGLRERLQDRDYAKEYVNAAARDSLESFLLALRDVAEARNMSRVAESARVNRENMYRMLSKRGNPRLKSLRAITESLFDLPVGIIDVKEVKQAAKPPVSISNHVTPEQAAVVHESAQTIKAIPLGVTFWYDPTPGTIAANNYLLLSSTAAGIVQPTRATLSYSQRENASGSIAALFNIQMPMQAGAATQPLHPHA